MSSQSHGMLAGCGVELAGPVWGLFPRSHHFVGPLDRWGVATDVTDNSDTLTFSVDVPGIDPKELKVSIKPGRLEIRGSRHFNCQKSASHGYSELMSGAFLRTFSLPKGLALDKAKATSKNGVLTVSIPKTEEARPFRIPVNGIQHIAAESSEMCMKPVSVKEGWLGRAKTFLTGLFGK